MNEHDFVGQVLKLVAEPEYRPMTIKAMSRRFEVRPDEYGEFRNSVKALIRQGRLVCAKDKTLSQPATHGTIVGLFRRSSKGFGFVRPHTSAVKTDQIYIPPDAGRDASSGDEVVVKITKRHGRAGMNPEGRVVQILERASGIFVGTYFEQSGRGFVKVDGTTIHEPVYVGDPGAKGAKPGDKVALDMVRYPSAWLEGEGVITEILGPRGQPGVDTLSIIRAFGIPDSFDEETLQEAREQARLFSEAETGDRLDVRDVLTVTIDPAAARDFDDAITLERDERGYWNLGVHIADVAHFVPAGSALDRTARQRGTSVYLPDRVIPMLPEVLSNSLASLQAGRVRYTVSALLQFNSEGIRTDHRFARSVIRVDRRFSYEEAIEVMRNPADPPPGISAELGGLLGAMLELAMLLRRRRFERGALELNMPEIGIALDDLGKVAGARLISHDESHQVIEEFMLAANEAVATALTEKRAGFLRRSHPDPEPAKLRLFADFVRSLGFVIDQPESRFELQRVLAEAATRPEAHAVHYGLLRSLKQAVYTPEPHGHYALASDNYCHFTSPIRRYPDLQVHRQLIALVTRKSPKSQQDALAALAEHCTRTERRAEAAEREVIKIKLLTYLEDHIGVDFHAVIVRVEDFGLFCRLVELPVEGLLHVTGLADDFYYLEAETHTLIGRRSGRRYRLGDRVEVQISHIDLDRRELDLHLSRNVTGSNPALTSRDLTPTATRRAATRQPRPDHKSKRGKATKAPGKKGKRRRT
jgi:ribonuclease R